MDPKFVDFIKSRASRESCKISGKNLARKFGEAEGRAAEGGRGGSEGREEERSTQVGVIYFLIHVQGEQSSGHV
jgi:hypothetical protein